MTEEHDNAAMAGSIGIIMAIGVSAFLAWFLLLGLLFPSKTSDTTLQVAHRTTSNTDIP